MTTVIAVYNSDGCVGRCDARCHGAKSKKCDCICGGKNHGAGLAQATQNTHEMIGLTDDDLKRFAEAHDKPVKDLAVINRIKVPSARTARRQAKASLIEPELFGWKPEA